MSFPWLRVYLTEPTRGRASREVVELEVKLQRCLDFTDENVRRDWDVALAVLLARERTVSQGLAIRVREAGAEAIIVPSRFGRVGTLGGYLS